MTSDGKGLEYPQRDIARHRPPELIVRLCYLFYVRVNCGFRTIQETLNILNEVFEGYFGKTPSHTIENWYFCANIKFFRIQKATVAQKLTF